MSLSQADRERFAPLFGWTGVRGNWLPPNDGLVHRRMHGSLRCWELPDFCDTRGQYFGPMVVALTDDGWQFDTPCNNLSGKYLWTNDGWCPEQKQYRPEKTIEITDEDPGLCTLLAYEAMMKGKI